MKTSSRSYLTIFLSAIACIAISSTLAYSANVSLQWDANNPAPEGYRVYARESGQSYNYNHPIWENNLTSCTLSGLVEGITYHFVVRAFDGNLESADSAELIFTPASVVPNQAPSADAGQNQSVFEGASVALDGSGSSDSDGSIVGYQWTQTGGSNISMNNTTTDQATFTAPVVGMAGETLMFRLTVTDDDGSTAVATTTVNVLKSSSTDVDGDNVPDVLDLFPNDPNEWADNDADGTGDNQDADDDNDGMTDDWELTYGLDPLNDDSDLDADGDGVTNINEFQANSDPTTAPSNTVPEVPVIDTINQTQRVELTPALVTAAYFDADNDDHIQSQWQISTDANFSTLILDETSAIQLTAYTVGQMVLDADTVYYWRVKFFDSRNGASDWSQVATFTTIAVENSDDTDINGIPDAQEVNDTADVDANGTPDCQESGIMSLYTVEGDTAVGIEILSNGATLVSVKSLSCDAISDQSVKMGFGLIGFKLYLQNGVTTATVKMHFGMQVPDNAQLYKYSVDNGWQVYNNAVFAVDGKSVTLMLEDGGAGDEDGVQNGVIVDPSGVAFEVADSASLSTGGGASSGGGGCFITAGNDDLALSTAMASSNAMLMLMVLLGTGLVFAAAYEISRK